MVGAAIGSAVIGGISSWNEADKASDAAEASMELSQENLALSVDAAEEQLQYSRDAMDQYITSTQANIGVMEELDWGGGSREGIEFAQTMMDDWEGTFGGIQDNLSEYYSNLDPTKFATQSKATLTRSMDKQMQQFNETMASSGLQSAGMKQQTAKEAMFRTAEGSAQIDIDAPEQVAGMQRDFLATGERQRGQAQDAMSHSLSEYGQMEDRATVRRSGAIGDAYNRAGEAYRTKASMTSPVVSAYQGASSQQAQTAGTYIESAAGHSSASGTMFGTAMNLGIEEWGDTKLVGEQ